MRIALPEHHGFGIVDCQNTEVGGRRHRDGSVRGYTVFNLRTGQTLARGHIHPAIWVLVGADFCSALRSRAS